MRFAFRVDSSSSIGHGHAMRCLALANALKSSGHDCTFVTRELTGFLIEPIASNGHRIAPLAIKDEFDQLGPVWPEAMQQQDSEETSEALSADEYDWLIVDHYRLDSMWHRHTIGLQTCPKMRLAVIDDLANRHHKCDLLIDHNAGRQVQDYQALVPAECRILTGPNYAILRDEFKHEAPAVRAPINPAMPRLFICFGGVDAINATCATLECLRTLTLPKATQVTVVMGSSAMWMGEVTQLVSKLSYTCEILQNPKDMAMRMNTADIGIGAVGVSALERCAMGLPSIGVVVSENQVRGASALAEAKTMIEIQFAQLQFELPQAIAYLLNSENYLNMANRAKQLCDGQGVDRIVNELEN